MVNLQSPVRRLLLAALSFASILASHAPAAEISATPSDEGVVIKINGQLFAEYLFRSGNKPVLWPIIGPTGLPMTRAYPLVAKPEQTKDHLHHRSLWLTHGSVNGVDFWLEKPGKSGTVRHRELVKAAGGARAIVATRNDWLSPNGKKICEDERTLTFGTEDDARWIDFDIVIKASEGPVTFGDTKEGTFAVRVPDTMRVEAKPGGKIVNSQGQTDSAAWGRPAAWVDYHGPVGGRTFGIAILNHPTSFRFPTYWHVRTYGLFAANPFGLKEFTRGGKDGTHTIAAGQQLALRYRVILHHGDEKRGKISQSFVKYAAELK